VSSLWIGDDGQVLYATPDARRWLASEDTEECPAGPPRISTAVAYRILAEERRGNTPHVVLRLRARDGWVTVHGERVRAADGSPHGIALVVQPAHPGELLPLAEAAFGLSEREVAVVRAVLHGADTRTAAKALHVTPYTVQDHLKSVFRKVGVNSRGELAEALTHLA
jgi:DNA-binding CsgD family transcriptional regulator